MEKEISVTIPNVKWAQRKEKLYVTIDAVDVKNPEIDLVNGKLLKFKGTTSTHIYAFEIELYDEVVKEESKFSLDGRNIFLNIKKKSKGPYWPRLTQNSQKLNWLSNDWRYYIDEDEEEEGKEKGPQFGNEFNFPGFNQDTAFYDDEMPDLEKEKKEFLKEDQKFEDFYKSPSKSSPSQEK